MLQFSVNESKCTKCGLCAQDCPLHIIAMDSGYPCIPEENEEACLGCRHCLAICPTAALSIGGHKPEESSPLAGALPDPDRLEALIKGRRSVRCYRNENLEPELLQRLLDVAGHAPSGANERQVRFTLIDDKEVLADFRQEVYTGLEKRVAAGDLPKGKKFFGNLARLWKEEGVDALFLGAPHLLVTSAPRSCCTPETDCLIALSYFELFAQSLGVGTLWDGLLKWAIDDLLPGLRQRLGIPEDHVIGFTMVFGRPAVHYQRTVENGATGFVRVAL